MAFVTAHLSEAAGGFANSIPGLANALNRRDGVEAHLVGIQDRSLPDAWRRWGKNVHAHAQAGPRGFGWARSIERTLDALDPDLTDAQGLWMYPSLVNLRSARRAKRPYMITPRGMLDPWALGRSRLRKRIVSSWFEERHLQGAMCLRALNEREAEVFRAYGLRNPVAIVPNGVDLPDLKERCGPESRTILFLGRIDPKKGIAELLRAWAIAVRSSVGRDWRLQLSGWGEGRYVASMETLAADLGLEANVTFTGPCYGDAKVRAFENAAAFILPSFSEGLPMAVLEAWSFALPVLMTHSCNLPEGFASSAALEIAMEPEAIAAALREFMSLSEVEHRMIGMAGRRLVENRFDWDLVASSIDAVYSWVLGGGAPPSCVLTS